MDPYFFVDVTASLPMIVLLNCCLFVVSLYIIYIYIVVGGFPLFHPEDWGRWKFFDEDVHIGWFNYQLFECCGHGKQRICSLPERLE